MAVVQSKVFAAFLFFLCLLVPLTQAKNKDVEYCSKKADYDVKVSGVEIIPYPVVRGKPASFGIAASTDKTITGGKVVIDVYYFGLFIHGEEHDLCEKTSCPVSAGDFVISHSQVLPGFTPPGTYSLEMTVEDGHKRQLTCINFGFSIGFAESEAVADN